MIEWKNRNIWVFIIKVRTKNFELLTCWRTPQFDLRNAPSWEMNFSRFSSLFFCHMRPGLMVWWSRSNQINKPLCWSSRKKKKWEKEEKNLLESGRLQSTARPSTHKLLLITTLAHPTCWHKTLVPLLQICYQFILCAKLEVKFSASDYWLHSSSVDYDSEEKKWNAHIFHANAN